MGYQGTPGRQGAPGPPGLYDPNLDEIIEGSVGVQGEIGRLKR